MTGPTHPPSRPHPASPSGAFRRRAGQQHQHVRSASGHMPLSRSRGNGRCGAVRLARSRRRGTGGGDGPAGPVSHIGPSDNQQRHRPLDHLQRPQRHCSGVERHPRQRHTPQPRHPGRRCTGSRYPAVRRGLLPVSTRRARERRADQRQPDRGGPGATRRRLRLHRRLSAATRPRRLSHGRRCAVSAADDHGLPLRLSERMPPTRQCHSRLCVVPRSRRTRLAG